MPSISMFFGIIIYMYFDEHRPPHFHAKYQDYEAVFDFDGELLEGSMPGKQLSLYRLGLFCIVRSLRRTGSLQRTNSRFIELSR